MPGLYGIDGCLSSGAEPCPLWSRELPGLVALFRDALTDEPRGIQRIFLDKNGERVGWRMLAPYEERFKLDGDGKSSKASALVRGSKPAWPRAHWALSRCGRWVAQVQFTIPGAAGHRIQAVIEKGRTLIIVPLGRKADKTAKIWKTDYDLLLTGGCN
jgi:hypothetical protein